MNETVLYQEPVIGSKAQLVVFDRTGNIQHYEVGEQLTIGRKAEGIRNDVELSSSIVSRHHGRIERMNDEYVYRDLGSLNGTYVDSVHYGKNESATAVKLKNGDAIRIDNVNLNRTHRSLSEAVLMVFLGSTEELNWKKMPIGDTTGDIEIGREVSKDGVSFQNEKISKKHATFRNGLSGWTVVDHDSTNGVYVNNQRIEQPTLLHTLDVIRIADVSFILLENAFLYNEEILPSKAPETQKESKNPDGVLQIHIKERAVRDLFKKKVILQDIDMSVQPGEMVLVLGGSGAGKTTFFNAVMGYEKADGTIRHGQVDVYKDYSSVKNNIGFVPQQDLVRQDDYVINTLENAAEMRMPKHTTAEERATRVDYVLDLLGLSRERNSVVRKLSGGQRKRLSIAIEFIGDPSLFFLDEPDSGLDGVMAKSLMQNLRVIADEGKIVMVITHQPDRVSFLFDKIAVLAKSVKTNSGHLAFYGSIPDCLAFFEAETLEGVIRKINRVDEGGEGLSDFFIEKYEKQQKGE